MEVNEFAFCMSFSERHSSHTSGKDLKVYGYPNYGIYIEMHYKYFLFYKHRRIQDPRSRSLGA